MSVNELDSSSGVPLYRQIKDILRREIIDGSADPQTPITEAQLLDRFDVSRAPIRQALKELSVEGFVYRKQGRGTFPVPGSRVHRPATHSATARICRSNSAKVVGVPSGAMIASRSGTASAARATMSWMSSIRAEDIPC